MMSKLIILTVIAVSVSAQFVSERRPNERDGLRINSDEPRVNQEYQEQSLRVNHRNPEHVKVGGFQNGHFAQNDGRLRTNLDSAPIVSESFGQNYQPRDSQYVVEEGAAFRRQDNAQYDVHSSLGRNVDVSLAATEDNNPHEGRQSQILDSQNGETFEQRPPYNQNINGQSGSRQTGQWPNVNEQGNSRDVNSNQNTQERNVQGNGNNDRKIHFDQATRQNGQNYDNNPQNERDQHAYTQYDARNNGQNNNRNTPQTTERSQNRGVTTRNTERPVSKIDSSRVNADKVTNRQNYDREADRELNNQITKMIFDESTLEVTTKSNTKTTKDNELPSRSSGKKDDKWIWGDGDGLKNATTTIVPTVDDRAAFTADQCPTGQIKFNNVCVDVD